MRRRFIQILAVVLLVIALAVVALFLVPVRQGPPADVQLSIADDSLLVTLPDGPQKAKTEMQRVRRAIAKLRPGKEYIVIDTHANKISLRTMDSTILIGDCSTGTGGELVDTLTGRRWIFNTPRGVFKVNSKQADPWWRKPDWAFFEEGEPLPENDDERMDPEMLGKYAMGFGDGYFIHGTIYERLLGINVTHGCVRVGETDLQNLYERVRIGTMVYIF